MDNLYSISRFISHTSKGEFSVGILKCINGYKQLGLRGKENTLYNYQYDENKNVISISGTITNNSSVYTRFYIDFYADTEINNLLKQTNTSKIFIDKDKPSECAPIGNITIFNSKASAYLLDDTLHIYNPDGGKIVLPEDCSKLFTGTTATEMDLHNLDTSQVKNMKYMFNNCNLLSKLNVSGWETANLQKMEYVFNSCTSLQTIDLNSWDTSKVTTMRGLFWKCSNLKSVEISELDVSNVTDFFRLFGNCSQLQNIDVSKWDTSSATTIGAMFESCNSLTKLDVTSFNTSKVKEFDYMFSCDRSLQELIGLDKFDTSSATSMSYMFYNTAKLKQIDFSNFDTSHVSSMANMFANNPGLTELDLSYFDTSSLYNSSQMFYNCQNLHTIYVSNHFVLNKLVDSNNMFRACPSLVGGAGTVFDPTFIDGTAARIDGGTESHGYFTHIVDKQNTATYSIEQTLDKDYQDDFEVEDEMSIPISDEELLLD